MVDQATGCVARDTYRSEALGSLHGQVSSVVLLAGSAMSLAALGTALTTRRPRRASVEPILPGNTLGNDGYDPPFHVDDPQREPTGNTPAHALTRPNDNYFGLRLSRCTNNPVQSIAPLAMHKFKPAYAAFHSLQMSLHACLECLKSFGCCQHGVRRQARETAYRRDQYNH